MARTGRKNKYDHWLMPENLLQIQSWAAEGMANKDMAALMGINPSTFCDWLNRFPELSEALKRGWSQRSEAIRARLHDVAMGYCTEETEVVERRYEVIDGEQVLTSMTERTTSRRVPPSVPALIFEAKNRCGYADNPNQARAEEADAEVREFIDGLGLK